MNALNALRMIIAPLKYAMLIWEYVSNVFQEALHVKTEKYVVKRLSAQVNAQ
jgi:hypothetical protein